MTRLDPAISYAGRAFILGARLPVDGETKIIANLWIDSYDPATGKIVFSRGTQKSSYTLSGSVPGSVTQVVYDLATGGNAVDSYERDRVYSVYNPMARRGSLASERCIVGDSLVRFVGSKRALFDVIAIEAYGESGPINYTPFEDLRTAYSENNGTGIVLEGANGYTVDFEYDGSGVATWDGVSAPIALERQLFNDDEFQFPDDAIVMAGKYYFNPISREVRFGAGVTTGHTAFAAYWLLAAENDVLAMPSATKDVYGQAGYETETLDFDETITLLNAGILRLGDVQSSGRGVYINLQDGTQGYRESGSDAYTDFSVPTVTYPAQFRFWRDGGRLRIYMNDALIFDVSGNVLPGGNILSVEGQNTRFLSAGAEERRHHVFNGQLRVQAIITKEIQDPAKMIVPDGFDVVAVERADADFVLTLGAPGRNGYVRSGDEITFRREAEGDLIRARLKASGPPPAPPGFCARIFNGQEGFCEFDATKTDGLPWASTSIPNNRANHRDVAYVAASFGNTLAAGDEVAIARGLSFAPSNATIAIYRDLPDGEGDWELVPSARYIWDPVSGTVLFDDVFAFDDTATCLKFEVSKRYRRGHNAELYNEQRAAWEHIETLFASPGAVGGPSVGFHGQCLQMFGPKSFTVEDVGDTTTTWWPADWDWGLTNSGIHGHYIYDDAVPEYIVRECGHFGSDLLWRDLYLRSAPPGPAIAYPNGDPSEGPIPQYTSHDILVPGEGTITVGPFGNLLQPLSFGSDFPGPEPEVNGPFLFRMGGANVGGVRFDPGPLIQRLPAGSQVISAFIPVKFSNLKERTWEWEGLARAYPGNIGTKYGYAKITVNGRNIIWNEFGGYDSGRPVDWAPDEYLDFVSGATLTLDIIGTRYDSLQQFTFANPDRGAAVVLPRRRFISGRGSIAKQAGTAIGDNEWKMINVTRAFRTALRMNDSPWQELHLLPSNGSPSTTQHPETLGNYLQGLCNEAEADVSNDVASHWTFSGTASGRIVFYDSFQVGDPFITYTIGGGNTVSKIIPGLVG